MVHSRQPHLLAARGLGIISLPTLASLPTPKPQLLRQCFLRSLGTTIWHMLAEAGKFSLLVPFDPRKDRIFSPILYMRNERCFIQGHSAKWSEGPEFKPRTERPQTPCPSHQALLLLCTISPLCCQGNLSGAQQSPPPGAPDIIILCDILISSQATDSAHSEQSSGTNTQ